MLTATEVIEKTQQHGQQNADPTTKNFEEETKKKLGRSLQHGDCWAQGDINVFFYDKDKFPPLERALLHQGNQIAEGNTKGSRHTLNFEKGTLDVFRVKDGNRLQAFCIEAREEFTVEHPEHGDLVCKPGCYRFTHQRAAGREVERVQD